MKAPADLAWFDRREAGEAEGLGARAWREADAFLTDPAAAPLLASETDAHATDSDAGLRAWVHALGEAGLLGWVVPSRDGGRAEQVSALALAAVRERIAYASPLGDLAFAMQGLGSYPISAHGSDAQRAEWLPGVREGRFVAAIALTEPEAGSDLGNVSTRAVQDGDHYVVTGDKTFISNAPVADFFVTLVRTGEPGAKRALSALVVPAKLACVAVTAQDVLGDHPIGTIRFEGARVPKAALLGDEGSGMGVALGTLHRFRATVGAAAVGFAARALDETRAHVQRRVQFGAPLAELQAVQLRLADMAVDLTTARLLVLRAASLLDTPGIDRETQTEAISLAKFHATEAAQRIVDHAVQLHGGAGVLRSSVVARLYAEVRSLRIYEGTSDVQKLLIARSLLDHKRHG